MRKSLVLAPKDQRYYESLSYLSRVVKNSVYMEVACSCPRGHQR